MTREQNIRAILETNFAGFKEDIIDNAVNIIMNLPDEEQGNIHTFFIDLDDVVNIAYQQFNIDPELARQEFMQKCYFPDRKYQSGYIDGINDSIQAIREAYLRKEN